MDVEITTGETDNKVPYSEIRISPSDPRDGVFFITFRKYPKRVFVGVEDYREDFSSGQDLLDCWEAPTCIISKTLIEDFDPYDAWKKALVFLGELDPQDKIGSRIWSEVYADTEGQIQDWIKNSHPKLTLENKK